MAPAGQGCKTVDGIGLAIVSVAWGGIAAAYCSVNTKLQVIGDVW